MAASNADIAVNASWQDLVATYAGLASTPCYVQNKGPNEVLVMFTASASQPSSDSGILLRRGDVAYGTSAHVWVKGLQGVCGVQCGLTD